MKIIIVGGGKIGASLAGTLIRENADITVIDNNREVLTRLSEAMDIMALYGNGAAPDILREAEADKADILLAVTPEDETNLLCCIIGRKLGCGKTIARVRNPEYSRQLYTMRGELGIDMVMNPEWAAAREIFRLMQMPAFLKRDAFSKGRVEIVELEIDEGSPFAGLTLMELPRKIKVRALVCAVERDGEVVIPGGAYKLAAGDRIWVTAATTDLVGLVHSAGKKQRRSKSAIIIGGGRITRYLAPMLIKTGVDVRIIEKDRSAAVLLAELLPGATIINADGTDQTLLRAENIEQMDSVVSLTGYDEENLIISMYANYVGVPQVITKINRTEYNEMFSSKGIDCVISPKLLCADIIVSYVRGLQNAGGREVITVHDMVGGKAEAIEFSVAKGSRFSGVSLYRIPFKPNVLIACINRSGKIIIPTGTDTMEPGDTVVVVVAKQGNAVMEPNDIFKE